MRILNVTQIYYPFPSGPAIKVKTISENLARRGHQITVLTGDMVFLKGWKRRVREENGNNVENMYLPTWTHYRWMTINPGVILFCLRRLREFDLIHIYGLYDLLGTVVTWFCRRWDIAYIVEPMGMYQPIVRSVRKKRLYHRLLGQNLMKGAAYLIATSEQEQREFVEGGLPRKKIVLRRNGLDLSQFSNLPPRGKFRTALGLNHKELLVLFLGRLSFIKGLDLLVKAFSRITINAKLVIAGPDDGDGCLSVISQIKEKLNLGDRVSFLGPLYGTQKIEAFVDSNVLVLPSRYESFGNVAAEAIACGVPVIVTDRCGIAPCVKDRVGLVIPCNVEALREAIHSLLTNPVLQNYFRSNTNQVKQDLSWDQPIIQMEQLYNSILHPDLGVIN